MAGRVPRSLGVALVLALGGQAFLQTCQFFAGPATTRSRPIPRTSLWAEEEEAADEGGDADEAKKAANKERTVATRIRIKRQRWGVDLDGDKMDNLDEWYKDTISGKGGKPTGFMKDLILRSFYGTWHPRRVNSWFKMSRDYTGPNKQPSETDHEQALENLKTNLRENKNWMGQDDGKGWFWLACTQTPIGLNLYVTKSPPYGERPLALIREDNIDEFFDKVNWYMLFVRLHKMNLWGGKAQEFPYPLMWKLKS